MDEVFPVTLTRVGGIAGFDDLVTVEASGATTVAGKLGEPRTCWLSPAALGRLEAAVRALSGSGPRPGPSGRISDRMTVSVTTASAGRISLGEGQGDEAEVVTELLTDLTGAEPAYRLCVEPPDGKGSDTQPPGSASP